MRSVTRRGVAAGGVLLLIAAVALFAVDPFDHSRTVALPPVGQVSADAVDDTPVFVVHADDGRVYVLDAISPHTVLPKVLAWCESAGVFEDLWHGSMFDPTGRWITGPAPTDLARYEVSGRRADYVTVGDRQPGSDRPTVSRNYDLSAPRCADRTALGAHTDQDISPSVVDELLVHGDTDRFPQHLLFPTPERVAGDTRRAP